MPRGTIGVDCAWLELEIDERLKLGRFHGLIEKARENEPANAGASDGIQRQRSVTLHQPRALSDGTEWPPDAWRPHRLDHRADMSEQLHRVRQQPDSCGQ